eukprot:scaffold10223_cov61-Cyclotella_meneghiniana.AAC.2
MLLWDDVMQNPFTACNSRYNFNNTTTNPADRRAKDVSEYKSRFQNLDKHYAPDVVGDGNGGIGITGPFESAQNQLHCGQVIPLCGGAFGEANCDFTRLIKVLLAQEASSSEEGLSILSLVNTDRKGGDVFPIMHSQFKRAIGVAIARANANATHKLVLLHYVRAINEPAAYTAKTNNSQHRWNTSQTGRSSWIPDIKFRGSAPIVFKTTTGPLENQEHWNSDQGQI